MSTGPSTDYSTKSTDSPDVQAPNPDFEKPAGVFKPFKHVIDTLRASGFVFDSDNDDPDAPDSLKVKSCAGITHDSKQWVAMVFHINDEVVRVLIGQLNGGPNVTIDAIRPRRADVQHAIDALDSALVTPLGNGEEGNVSTFFRSYVDAKKVRVMLAHGNQGILDVSVVSSENKQGLWCLQASSFKGAYRVPTVHTEDDTSLASLWIDEGASNWFLTADGGDTNFLHSTTSMRYYSDQERQLDDSLAPLIGEPGFHMPANGMETSVDKIVLDQTGLKNFCEGAQKWLESNEANTSTTINTEINDNYQLLAVGDAAPDGYELMYSTKDESATFEISQIPEVKFILWMCSQSAFTSNQKAISAICEKSQAFIDYKSSSAGD